MAIIDTRYGKFTIIDTDNVISQSLQLYGEWAQIEIDLLAHFIHKGSTVVDAGAFIGTHTRAFSKYVGSTGKIIAFEPRLKTYNFLVKNANAAPILNIEVLNVGLGSTSSFVSVQVLDLNINNNFGALSLQGLTNEEHNCNTENITINPLDIYSFERLDFLKIDVEGMEIDVLKGADKTIKSCKPVIFAECNSLEGGVPVLLWAKENNYTIYGIVSLAYNQNNYMHNDDNIFGCSSEAGLLLIPKTKIFQYNEIISTQNIPAIMSIDDLSLLLLHKPQYPYEVLMKTSSSNILTIEYPSPLADSLTETASIYERNNKALAFELLELDTEMRSCNIKNQDLNALLNKKEQEINLLNNKVAELDGVISKFQKSSSWRLTKPIRKITKSIQKRSRKVRKTYKSIKKTINAYFDHKEITEEQNKRHDKITVSEFMMHLVELPKEVKLSAREDNQDVTVVIPVYKGIIDTKKCIESILKSENNARYKIIIINDNSPEPEIKIYLLSIEKRYSHVRILNNNNNLGFVGSVNRGIKLADKTDVILLNSDTVVANNWIDRLINQAYTYENIGTVTPFSNNATICNYPDINGWDDLKEGETVTKLDHAFSYANAGMSVQLPTAVGFCMYIKNKCLNDVGLFDQKSFGKGYGEENDFCLRATKKGWKHVLATDIFVFHKGEISFGAMANAGKASAMDIIRKKYPYYESVISCHIEQDPAKSYRVRATAARFRINKMPIILFITHSLGGGTEKHVQNLAYKLNKEGYKVIFLRPISNDNVSDVILESYNKDDSLKIELSSQNLSLLAEVIKLFGVIKIHIHHTIGFVFSVEELTTLLNIPYDYTIHDFFVICPRVHLRIPNKGYCGSPTIDDCNICLSNEPKIDLEIIWWRAKYSSLLNGAEHVYCPSNDTAKRIKKYHPFAPIAIIPHEEINPSEPHYSFPGRNKIRIALLGVLAEHKGLKLIEEAITIIQKNNMPLEFNLIGYTEPKLDITVGFNQTGPYEDSELLSLIDSIDPDAILIPAQIPETYSYTLSAALLSGRPIVVSNIGALQERIAKNKNSFIFPYNITGLELVNYLISLPLRKNNENI